MMSLKEK